MKATFSDAHLFLRHWAAQMIAREGGQPYTGNLDAGEYRPTDDPHPEAFVVLQVETCLACFDVPAPGVNLHRALMWELYVWERPVVRSWSWAHDEVLAALVSQIGYRERGRLSARAVGQARRQIKERDSEFARLVA